MSLKINYLNKLNYKIKGNFVFFLSKNYKFDQILKSSTKLDINKIAKNILSKNSKESAFYSYDLNVDQKIIFIQLGQKLLNKDYEQLGAKFFDHIKKKPCILNPKNQRNSVISYFY